MFIIIMLIFHRHSFFTLGVIAFERIVLIEKQEYYFSQKLNLSEVCPSVLRHEKYLNLII